jgi:hypothetical protein
MVVVFPSAVKDIQAMLRDENIMTRLWAKANELLIAEMSPNDPGSRQGDAARNLERSRRDDGERDEPAKKAPSPTDREEGAYS